MQHLKSLSILVCILFTIYLYIPDLASTEEFNIQQDRTSEVMRYLEFPYKEDEIGKNWEIFLNKRTRRFGNKDYQMAIHKLKTEFNKSYASFNACIEKTTKESAEYSSSWANKFQQRFGKEYIHKNFDSIRLVMIALSIENNMASCEEQEKEALYREYRYLDAVKNYIEYFAEFSGTLNKNEKNRIGRGISVAESYLKNFEFPLQSTLSKESLNNALYLRALKTQQALDPQLADFFSGLPIFRKPFALGKALDDLKALQKN